MKLKNPKYLGKYALTLCAILFAWPGQSHAAKFANQFTEFELPPQWQCNLEGAEWVCQSTNDTKKRDAIIVLAAKLKGDQDSLDQYLTYLKAAKTFNSIQGKPVKSDPKYAKTINLNGQAWVDALHLESEIPGFYTRYLATVKQDIGVLVTYSINKGKYQTYLDDFDNMVKTLKVFRKTGGINVAPQSGNLFQNTQIPQNVGSDTVFPGAQIQGGAENKPVAAGGDNTMFLLLGAGAAVVGFIIWRKKKNSGG
ncbi:MAG: hypothetical protein HYX41_02785 [Bdellovibrio sp.]|nr:hypothetical protein [Bdellovibrio sp.]